MTRGEGDAIVRGISEVDEVVRPEEVEEVDDLNEQINTWKLLTRGTRAATPVSIGGLLVSDDWVVLTACRQQELAYEFKFDGVNSSGTLTYWLLDTLHSGMQTLSYKQLHQQVMARVKSQFHRQRPQLYGDGNRTIFGRKQLKTQFAVPVVKISQEQNSVTLNAGHAQGVRRNAKFAIFPITATDLNDFEKAVAQVTVKRDGATTSLAFIDEQKDGTTIELGSQAVYINPTLVRLRRLVRLQKEGDGSLTKSVQAALHEAYQNNHFKGFIEWVGIDDPAEFTVALSEDGKNLEIWDATGEVIPHINPPLPQGAEKSAEIMIERLIHLTRYRNVSQLVNSDSRAKGVPQIAFEWLDISNGHVFIEGDIARLLVRNESEQDIEIVILELSPDWSITQIYPEPPTESYTFAPGEEDTLEFEVFVEGNDDEETTIFKLFATVEGTNFRMLELPSLDTPITRGMTMPSSELEKLLALAVETTPPTRAGRMRSSAARKWVSAQVELRVRR